MFGYVCVTTFAAVIGFQTPAPPAAQSTANPELVGALAQELGSTPQQAEGAAGALFGLAKSRLNADDWKKVAGAVPGIDGLLKAAPAAATGTAGSAVGAIAGAAGSAGAASATGLASVAGAFQALKLKPELAAKAVPILTKYVTKSGGAQIGQLLAGVLR
jgi:hypothetical protein